MFCLSLLDDRDLFSARPVKSNLLENLITSLFFIGLGYVLTTAFGVSIGNSEDPIHSEIKFTFTEFEEFLSFAVPVSVVIGLVSLTANVVGAIVTLIFYSDNSFITFIVKAVQFVAYLTAVAFLFAVSLVPYTTLDRGIHKSLPPVLHSWYREYSNFHLSSSYGLFRSMTGVGGRPELVLEGAKHISGPWTEIPFKYKPGALDRPCPFIVPHQPRLDWQMWFAALDSYHRNPWLTSLAYRILTNETNVVHLLDQSIFSEFEDDWPPKYIKGTLYNYHYTPPGLKNNGNWWYRELAQRSSDYLPIFTAEHPPLIDYLRNLKIIGKKEIKSSNQLIVEILDKLWFLLNFSEPHIVVWGLLLSAMLISRLNL